MYLWMFSFHHRVHGVFLVTIYLYTPIVIQTTEGRKNLGSIHNYIYEDVREILRFALNDNLVLTDISFKDYSALITILAAFNPLPVAVKVMSPGLPFVWTMAVIIPLNTCIFGSWKSSMDTELPLAPAR